MGELAEAFEAGSTEDARGGDPAFRGAMLNGLDARVTATCASSQ